MIKNFIKYAGFSIGLSFYVSLIAFIISMITGTIWLHSEGEVLNINRTLFAASVGVFISLPLLLLAIFPWLNYSRNNPNFLNWVVFPTLFATLYSFIFLLYFTFAKSGISFVFLFPITGFLTSFVIWLTFKNKFLKDLIPKTHETDVIENANN